MLRSLLTQSFNIVNPPIILLFSKQWVPGFAAEDNIKVSKTMLFKYIKKIWGNYPLCGVITQLAARCRNANMGFQKLEPISFDLMHVDQ